MTTHPELESEQQYLDRAYQRVDELKEAARTAMAEVLDVGKGGTFQARTERDMVVRSSLARLQQLDIGNQPLCFGRIDEVQGDHYYIGRMGVSGRDQEPLVVDWRAPVAEPFYRATGRVPMGLARRRHFELQGRVLVAIEDEPLVLSGDAQELPVSGQGALLAALERSRSGRMHDIVATIQGEQDEVIRAPLPGVLVVQGGPGTGKTAVALHRAAYLLYTHRFPLEHQGVLVVGPNPVFLRYVSHVLPSLGETGVTLATISGLVTDAQVRGIDTPAAAAVKGDPRMVKVIARAVRSRQRGLRHDVEIGFGPYRLRLRAADSEQIVNTVKRRGGTHNARRKRVERLLAQHLYAQYQQAVERARKLDPSARDAQLHEFTRALKEIPVVVEALDRMWPRLHAVELVHDLFGARPLVRLAARGVLEDWEADLLVRRRSRSLDAIAWTDADIALIDEARVLLGPVRQLADDEPFTHAYGHIVVDEAQDLSPMQLRMLGRRSIGGSMTIVGDVAQATGPWAPSRWDEVLSHLPRQWASRQVELTIGYRTPAEAMQLAAKVLDETGLGLQPPRPVRSSGIEPVIVHTADDQVGKQVAMLVHELLQAASEGTVGVIAPNALLDAVSSALGSSGVDFDLAGARALDLQVAVLNASLAKGLEFDGVIVVEPAMLIDESRQGLRSLYVALTRPTQRLAIVHSRPLPRWLA